MEQRENSELGPGFKMTELGPLPEDWSLIKLGDIADIKYGKAKPKTRGSIPVIGSGGVYDHTNISLVDFPTIIIGRKGKAGFAWLAEEPSWPSDTTFYLDWRRQLDIQYIFHYLTLKPLSGEYAKTTLPSIQKPDLENYMIPFPPLDEQPKIAYVLNAIQRGIGKTGKVIDAARELKKSLMRHLFTYGPVPYDQVDNVPLKETEIGPVPEYWYVGRIEELVEFTRKPRNLKLSGDQIPFIPMELIPSGSEFNTGYISKRAEEIKSGVYCENGDILLAKITPSFENGKQGIVDIPTNYAYATTEVYPLKAQPDKLDRMYLFCYLKVSKVREDIAGKMEGTTGRQRVPKAVVENYRVPLPPLPEQQEIAHILQTVDRKIEAEENRKRALEALFKTLLHYLMTGKIRVKGLIGSQGINSRL